MTSSSTADRGDGPRRTCVGCGCEAGKSELLRIALAHDANPRLAVLDRDGRLGGRGAYLCRREDDRPRAECLAAAVRRGAFARALRAKVTLDPKLVESMGR
jgi:predicted RNA-binding protein YlxR (DUF448 family)